MKYDLLVLAGTSLLENFRQNKNHLKKININGLDTSLNRKINVCEAQNQSTATETLDLLESFDESSYLQLAQKIEPWICNVKCIDWNKSIRKMEREDQPGFINQYASAEINTILAFLREKKDATVLHVHMFATDSAMSALCARLHSELENCLQKEGISVRINFDIDQDIIHGLQLFNLEQFRKMGIPELTIWIMKKIYALNVGATYICATGGYKAVMPILTMISQLMNVPLVYLHESSTVLLQPPVLGIQINEGTINWQLLEFVDESGTVEIDELSEEQQKVLANLDSADENEISTESLLEIVDGLVALNDFGEILMAMHSESAQS